MPQSRDRVASRACNEASRGQEKCNDGLLTIPPRAPPAIVPSTAVVACDSIDDTVQHADSHQDAHSNGDADSDLDVDSNQYADSYEHAN